ncbi:hypothetical protein N665_0054s0016 [Sinapis alba]|nr:hypothetical protein N665_0054s0016 [Sinapis alba]
MVLARRCSKYIHCRLHFALSIIISVSSKNIECRCIARPSKTTSVYSCFVKVMAPRERLTREQKGKAVAKGPDLARSVDPRVVDSRSHREALSDMAGLDLAQRRLVADVEMVFLNQRDGNGAREGISPKPEVVAHPPRRCRSDFVHGRLSLDGFVELPPVPARLRCSPDLSDRMEKFVGKSVRRTGGTPSSVQALLEKCGATGVTYLIPTEQERPWSPPIGYQCVYEAYFEADTKLWFPIPRLVTSYVSRRQVAISQFGNGSYRIAVALMVFSAEIDISLNVRAFEELTSVKALKEGLFTIRMRLNYNIITDHPNKTHKWKSLRSMNRWGMISRCHGDGKLVDNTCRSKCFDWKSNPLPFFCLAADHPKTLDYPGGFFDSARAIACLSHSRWPDISEERVQQALERISRGNFLSRHPIFPRSSCLTYFLCRAEDWDSRSPVIKKDEGKRLALFTTRQQARINKARKMDNMVDLSDLIDDELDSHQANPMSILDDMDLGGTSTDGPHGDVSAEEEMPPIVEAAGAKRKGAKRPSQSGDDIGPSDEPPRKRKKEKATGVMASEIQVISLDGSASRSRESEASLEGGGSLAAQSLDQGGQVDETNDQLTDASAGLSETRSIPEETPLTEGPPVDPVEFLHSGNSLLVKDRGRCAELIRQIKGEPFDFPAVTDLTFGDLYERAAQDQLTCIGSSNLLIAKYERELKHTLVQLGRAQEVAQEKDHSLVCNGEGSDCISGLRI